MRKTILGAATLALVLGTGTAASATTSSEPADQPFPAPGEPLSSTFFRQHCEVQHVVDGLQDGVKIRCNFVGPTTQQFRAIGHCANPKPYKSTIALGSWQYVNSGVWSVAMCPIRPYFNDNFTTQKRSAPPAFSEA